MLGVFIVSYGDAWMGGTTEEGGGGGKGSNPVVGNMLALGGSLAFAGYEVFYKLYVVHSFFFPFPLFPSSSSSSSPELTKLTE
jgi:drug/metabolite transporter (DMT)-like permease